MGGPHGESADTTERRERTALGYRRFRCPTCKREFNERTGTRFNQRGCSGFVQSLSAFLATRQRIAPEVNVWPWK